MRHSSVRTLVTFVIVGLFAAACGSSGQQPISPLHGAQPNSPLAPVAAAPADCIGTADHAANLNQLGFDLYRVLADDTPADNLIFSPYGVAAVFSMAYAGARGATADEMATALHFLPQTEHHAQFQALICRLAQLSPSGSTADPAADTTVPFQLHSANGLFPQAGFALADDFQSTLMDVYAAQTEPLDYAGDPSGAVDWINAWVREHTAGRIPQLLSREEVTELTKVLLANAVFFKAAWQRPFGATRTEPGLFTLVDGTQVTTPFMHGFMRAPYLRGDGFQAALLPYAGDAVDLLVVLPDAGRFDAVARRLNLGETLVVDPATAALDPTGLVYDITLSMPKFTFESDINLIDALRNMGLEVPFVPGTADFSGITDSDNGLSISAALQKAMIAVDENGTEAAAATAADMAVSARERAELALDRPFLFAVRERETQAILFLGQVMNPVN